MSGEQVTNSGTTPQVFLPPLTFSDGKDVNIFLLLTLLQKGTLDFDGEYRKYAAQKQADGEFLMNLMKMLEEAVSAKGNKLKYKDVEKVIDRYFKNHDLKNMSAGQLIALFDIKNMCKGLKDKDANILDLIGKVEHDIEKYNHYQHLVDDDKAKIKHALKKAKKCGKHLDAAGAAYWLGVAGYYEAKLKLHDEPNRDKWAGRVEADTAALAAAEEDEDCYFGSITSKWSILGSRDKALGNYETASIDRSDKNIIEFSRHLIENSTVEEKKYGF